MLLVGCFWVVAKLEQHTLGGESCSFGSCVIRSNDMSE